eukprot:jgi/Botrbrau1/13538/Bobra.0347s0022.1
MNIRRVCNCDIGAKMTILEGCGSSMQLVAWFAGASIGTTEGCIKYCFVPLWKEAAKLPRVAWETYGARKSPQLSESALPGTEPAITPTVLDDNIRPTDVDAVEIPDVDPNPVVDESSTKNETTKEDTSLDPALLDSFHSPASSPQLVASVVQETSPAPMVNNVIRENGYSTSSIPKSPKSPATKANGKNPPESSRNGQANRNPRNGKGRRGRGNASYGASQAVHA